MMLLPCALGNLAEKYRNGNSQLFDVIVARSVIFSSRFSRLHGPIVTRTIGIPVDSS